MTADLSVHQAQSDVRTIYRGGQFGPLVSAIIWLAAALAGDLGSPSVGVAVLFFGGIGIFPLSSLMLKLSGGPSALPKGHPMVGLATQVAVTVPLGLLVAVLLWTQRAEWFFPAALVIVGAHYLPFVHLYGMRIFAVGAIAMMIAGAMLVLTEQTWFSLGGYIGAVLLLVLAILCRISATKRTDAPRTTTQPEESPAPGSPEAPA